MSKEKPEVGDIFYDGCHRIRIDDEVYDRLNCFYCYILIGGEDEEETYIENEILSLDILQNKCTYLGKSKVSIKELFDVKEEENGI